MEYTAGKGTTGMSIAGLTTGILGTVGSGVLGNLAGGLAGRGAGMGETAAVVDSIANLAGVNRCSDNTNVTRYELGMVQKLMEKDSEIALLKSEQNTEVKIADVYERIMTKLNAELKAQSDWNSQQMVNNCQMSGAIARNAESIAALQGICGQITKTVVPKEAICPEFMDRYNSWTAPTA